MNVQIDYLNGDIDCFSAPAMDLNSGYVIQNDHLILNPKSLLEQGLVWERDYFTFEDTDPSKKGLHLETITILPVEQLKDVRSISVDGNTQIVNLEGEFCFADNLADEEIERYCKFANDQRVTLNNLAPKGKITDIENVNTTQIDENEMFVADEEDGEDDE